MNRKRKADYDSFAISPPITAALSDHPLEPDESWIDRFNFPFQLGAIYDILRHPETKTPLTIGIYGAWGSGKTSAMRWLEGLLRVWNSQKDGKNKIKPISAWFYPWKYQTREDVWRGIVAEVILSTMNRESARPEHILFAVKRFGSFLGKSFVKALASVKLKIKDPTGMLGEGEVTFQAIEKILEDFQELKNPERAYLNIFESMLNNWVAEHLGKNERLILFIDDLDRCLPSVTLEVLEAIKLYLNIPGLIFVVGLDRTVVESIVINQYTQQGVDKSKAQEYLAKMFQVDTHLFITQQSVHQFIDDQLQHFDIFKKELDGEHQKLFKNFFSRYSVDSPREVKRVINAAMIAARGWSTFDMGNNEEKLKFGEGLQRHFIRLRLRELGREKLLATQEGNSFLAAWSKLLNTGVITTQRENDTSTEYRVLSEKFPIFSDLLEDYLLGDLLRIYEYRTSISIVIQEKLTPLTPRLLGVRKDSGKEYFDAFLSYSRDDENSANELAKTLEMRGLKVWLDTWYITPGRPWQEELELGIRSSHSILVLFGAGGIEPWNSPEIRAFLEEAILRRMPVIPVLLPGASSKPKLPLFLKNYVWVDLREGFSDESGIDRLIWGITGIRTT